MFRPIKNHPLMMLPPCVFQAMLPRHWTRLSELTGHSFQVESESFSLRNIMEAPLLKYKEDLEVSMLCLYGD